MLKRFLVSISCVLCCNALAIDYPKVANNVAYSDVIKLEFTPAVATLSYGDNALQFGKLWLPQDYSNPPNNPDHGNKKHVNKKHGNKTPMIIFIHGGCWLNAFSIDHSYPLTSALAENGYAVFSVEYRRTGDEGGGWPGTFADIKKAINFILQQSDFQFDKSKVVLAGHSAGGHLALLAAQDEAISLPLIGLAAISDLAQYAKGTNSCQTATPAFMGGPEESNPQAYIDANPVAQETMPSGVLLHGTDDNIVPLAQSKTANMPFLTVQGAGHFDWLHPGSEAFSLLLTALEQVNSNE